MASVLLVKPKGKPSAIGYLVTEVMALLPRLPVLGSRFSEWVRLAKRVGPKTPVQGFGRKDALLEDYRLVSIEQNAVFHMPANSARQHDFFQIAALLDQIVDGVAMVDADDVLLDDGAVVEYLGNVVGGSADQLYAALERLVVGLGADERGQKRVMNIDQVLGAQGGDELVRKHLHVARQDDQTALVLADQRDLPLFRLAFVFFRDRHDEVRDAVKVGDALVVRMV